MQDLKTRLEKLLADAADCDLIGNLATDVAKRATFRRLAEQFRAMAADIRSEIVQREQTEHSHVTVSSGEPPEP